MLSYGISMVLEALFMLLVHLWLAVLLLTSKSQSKGLGWSKLLELLSQEGFFTKFCKTEVI